MKNSTRVFNGKDVDMLTAGSTIIEQAITNKAFLVGKRAGWADPFLPNLQKRIDDAFTSVLGIDSAQNLREATTVVTDLQRKAMTDLAVFKVQIDEDFKANKARKNEIFTRLGLATLLRDAQKGNQQVMIELLQMFKQNMTPALQNEIVSAGIAASLITGIKGYADSMKSANITQEALKGTRKVVSATSVTELNAIYRSVISVARISAKFYKADKSRQSTFSFSQAVKSQSLKASKKPMAAKAAQPAVVA